MQGVHSGGEERAHLGPTHAAANGEIALIDNVDPRGIGLQGFAHGNEGVIDQRSAVAEDQAAVGLDIQVIDENEFDGDTEGVGLLSEVDHIRDVCRFDAGAIAAAIEGDAIEVFAGPHPHIVQVIAVPRGQVAAHGRGIVGAAREG